MFSIVMEPDGNRWSRSKQELLTNHFLLFKSDKSRPNSGLKESLYHTLQQHNNELALPSAPLRLHFFSDVELVPIERRIVLMHFHQAFLHFNTQTGK